MVATIGGLAARGELVVLGAAMEPMEVPPVELIMRSRIDQRPRLRHLEGLRGHAALRRADRRAPMIETMALGGPPTATTG